MVHLDNGVASFSEAVGRVADALSPLGAAARVVAELSALAVEFRQIDIEKRRIDAARSISTALLEQRQREVETVALQMRSAGHGIAITSDQLTSTITALTAMLVDRYISEDERLIGHETMRHLSSVVVQLHQTRIDGTVRLSDIILNGGWFSVVWPRPILGGSGV